MKRFLIFPFVILPFLFSGHLFAQNTKSDNAALVYQDAVKSLQGITKDFAVRSQPVFKNDSSGNYDDFKNLVLQNEQAIENFKEGSRLEYCDFTFGRKIKNTITDPVPDYSGAINLARLTILQAKLFEQDGKNDQALDNYLSVLRLICQLNRQDNFNLLSNMISVIVQRIVYVPLSGFIQRKDLTADQADLLVKEMISLHKKYLGLDKAYLEEKEIVRKFMNDFARAVYNDRNQNKFSKVFEDNYNALFQSIISAYSQNSLESYRKETEKMREQVEREIKEKQKFIFLCALLGKNTDKIKKIDIGIGSKNDFQDVSDIRDIFNFYGPDLMAKYFVSVGSLEWGQLIPRYYIDIVNRDLLKTGAAVKSFEIKNRRFPDNLQVLVPDYLEDIPKDPFDDFKPLKFLKTGSGYSIYSFGPDKIDNKAEIVHSGKSEKTEEKGDLVFVLPNR